jgi:hypothetical protein
MHWKEQIASHSIPSSIFSTFRQRGEEEEKEKFVR